MSAGGVISSPTAEEWQVEFTKAQPELTRLARSQLPSWPLRVLRSSQLDAARLDAELHTMLQEQFMTIFQLFQQGRVSAFEPELNLLLSLLVYWLSVWRGRATPGSDLMNLRYRNERAMEQAAAAAAIAATAAISTATGSSSCQQQQQQQLLAAVPLWVHGGRSGIEGPGLSQQQKVAYAVGFLALPYLWSRLNRHAAHQEWGQRPGDLAGLRAWKLLRAVDAAHKLGMLINLWVFLYQGKYRTLVERVVGARLVYKQANMSRLISFEYLNRQLVWQELSEFLLFLLPLINVQKVRRFVLRLLPRMAVPASSNEGAAAAGGLVQGYPMAEKGATPVAAAPAAGDGKGAASSQSVSSTCVQQQQQQHRNSENSSSSSSSRACETSLSLLLRPVGPCGICGVSEILVPFVAYPCRHIFCYHCLRGHCEADQGFQCPLDDIRVEALQRYIRKVPLA